MKKNQTPTEQIQYWKDLKAQIKEDTKEFKQRFPNFSQEEMVLYCRKMIYSIENDVECVLSWKFPDEIKVLEKEIDGKNWSYTKIVNI